MKNVNSDIAYEHIRKKILSGDYAPGHALMTEVLSSEIGVSRTPVRDALRKLETDGLVVILPRVGASVKKMDLKEFKELCELRLALEIQTAGLAARNRNESDLREIEFALQAMRRATEACIAAQNEQPYMQHVVREDVRFHIAIMSAARNELMKKEILRLHLIHRVAVSPSSSGNEVVEEKSERDARRQRTLREHEQVYEAIANGDAAKAKQHMDEHLQNMIDVYMHTLVQSEVGSISRELTSEEALYNA